MTMSILKTATAVFLAGAGALAMSATAFAVTPTPAPAGPLTIALTCDTGPAGPGACTVLPHSGSPIDTVGGDMSATAPTAYWKPGSPATMQPTSAPRGALSASAVTI